MDSGSLFSFISPGSKHGERGDTHEIVCVVAPGKIEGIGD